jgi:ribosome maturation protein Sdo1
MRSGVLSTTVICTLLLLGAVSTTSYSQSEDAITETKAVAIINLMDRATRKRNVAEMVAPLTEDAKIRITIVNAPKSAKEQVLSLTKQEYAYLTKQALRTRMGYQFERKNVRVKIYDESTATVTSELYETFTIRRVMFRAVSSEVAFLSLKDGKIVVTAIEATMRFY